MKVKTTAKCYKKECNSHQLSKKYWQEKKTYKTLIREKNGKLSLYYINNVRKLKLKTQRNSAEKSMLLLKSQNISSVPIEVEQMDQYFKSLDGPENETIVNPVPGYEYNDILDSPINEEEVRMAIKYIKKNKVPGVDGLPPITFKLFNNHLIQFMTFLINKLLEEEVYLKLGAQA